MIKKSLKVAYRDAKTDIDNSYKKIATGKNIQEKKDAITECVFCIGRAVALAQTLSFYFGEDLRDERRNMFQIKDYLKQDMLENLEGMV